jgi:hypothetical protein
MAEILTSEDDLLDQLTGADPVTGVVDTLTDEEEPFTEPPPEPGIPDKFPLFLMLHLMLHS